MIKLSNFVSSVLQIALGQDVILSPACGCYIVVQPQVKNQGGTVTQVMSTIHLPSLRCPTLRCLRLNLSFRLYL